jgi:hypothetical protein
MKLSFISENTLQDLRINNNAYLQYYYSEDMEWFERYFQEEGKVLRSQLDFEMPDLSFEEDYALSDCRNVKEVYNSLKHMSVSQATQERVWTGLAHLQFRDFTFYRLKKDIDERNDKRIYTSLFFKHGKKRSLFVHILARLWWVGYMTYDETKESNPFWLTDFFTEKDFSARCVVFFSSNFTSNRDITIGILKALYQLNEQGINITRDYFVQATKYLNVVGGAMVLDMLNKDEVEKMIINHLIKVFNINTRLPVDV